jgi:hypothetical protein
LHPDWGGAGQYGIPYVLVPATQPMVPMVFDTYPEDSDPGPYPFPPDAPVEGGAASSGDKHVIVADTGHCKLYEVWEGRKDASGPGWTAANGAVFDLATNTYRPDGLTSGDAAGLPILPGLVRYDECAAGEIKHAVRFTVPKTQRGWIHPARHMASNTSDSTYPPMGLRMRLKASFDISTYTGMIAVLLRALKTYGMILADNGSAWFITGASDTRWDDNDLAQLKKVPGSAFEAVYTGPTKHSPEASGVEQTSPIAAVAELSVAPNPCSDATIVRVTMRENGRLGGEIVDAVGRVRARIEPRACDRGENAIRVRSETLENGTYIVRLDAGGRRMVRLLTVVK